MLDLEACVHLQEIETLRSVQKEFDGPRSDVPRGAGDRGGGLSHRRTQTRVERGASRFLHDLLVAPLHAALALEEVHNVARAIAEDLELHVSRAFEQFLEVHRVVTERGSRQPPRFLESRRQLAGTVDAGHPLAAAAG